MKRLDILAYTLLFLGLSVGAAWFLRLRYDADSQLGLILTVTFFYLVWAVFYHTLKRDLSRRLFLEYLLLAAIGATALLLVLSI